MSLKACLLLFLVSLVPLVEAGVGMLYPRDSESRQRKVLDGVWHFRVDASANRNRGFDQKWWEKPLPQTGPVIDMPVPSSYNDVTEDKELRDYVGWAWYDTRFYVSHDWSTNRRVVLRFDSVNYYAIVWVNGQEIMRHEGGHLPFEAEVGNVLSFVGANHVTVAVNNTLSPTSLPPGMIQYQTDTSKYTPGYFTQLYTFDFFNYAGIHRHVYIYTTPLVYVDDVTILTDINNRTGRVNYTVTVGGGDSDRVHVSILDGNNHVVAHSNKLSDELSVTSPKLWWPFGMNESVGYQYFLQVNVSGDVYRQPFGIRTVSVTQDKFLLNGKPFYCLGVGKHEDSDFRGRGLDYALIAKDFNLLRWLGVNCIRTSHYPYAEEIMEFADRQGVAVIDESPGVGINGNNFGNESLNHHLEVMAELVRRDKNRPSVIMWSVANEPASNLETSVNYFRTILDFTKSQDPAHRPVTFVTFKDFDQDKVIPYVDVICINRYFSWYNDTGHTEFIQRQLQRDFTGFRNVIKKPLIVTEYGADSVAGLHREPSYVFTEEYQAEVLQEYHRAFDKARQTFLVGEMVWNFADFMTAPAIYRVVGNKKGILTRQRQPKEAAFIIRERYNDIVSFRNSSCSYSRSSRYTSKPHSYRELLK